MSRSATGRIPGRRELEIRRLVYPDLPHVIAIERRVFPTPWSLAMFVLEFPSSRGCALQPCPGGGDRQLVGYLICSRYERSGM